MASNIDFENIDATFPVAGVDNSTQGFRDNFSVIKNSLSAARTEILQLQSNAVLKTPIPVTGVLDNNLAGSEIMNAKLSGTLLKRPSTVIIPGSNSNPVQVNFAFGLYHVFVLNSSVTLDIIWGEFYDTDHVKNMRIELVHSGADVSTYNIDFANTSIRKSYDWPSPTLQLAQYDIAVIDLWQYKESGANHPYNTPNDPLTYVRYQGKFA